MIDFFWPITVKFYWCLFNVKCLTIFFKVCVLTADNDNVKRYTCIDGWFVGCVLRPIDSEVI